ncbi:hypothetical protein [Streptomyces sp. NPDC087538]|uniref:hypothetical protein n=1 Tax=Streptomyces sp. NPDC087538 TaxID=3365797 RepID=UPI0038010BBC
MSSARIPQEDAAVPAVPDPAATVLYVCVDRGTIMPRLAAQRAVEEGQAFAQKNGLMVTEVVTDEYGEPDPCRRKGWRRVRTLAAAGEIASVLVRWPAAIAPEALADYRHRETRWLREHDVRVHYTWAPLAATGGESW